MKYLLILLLTLSANVLAAPSCEDNPNNPNCSGDYPGYQPNWTERYTVKCSMATVDGEARAEFAESGIDYAQAGLLMVQLNAAVVEWYEKIAEVAAGDGVDSRLLIELDPFVKELIRIEEIMQTQ